MMGYVSSTGISGLGCGNCGGECASCRPGYGEGDIPLLRTDREFAPPPNQWQSRFNSPLLRLNLPRPPARSAPPRLFPPRVDCGTAHAEDPCLCPMSEQERIRCDTGRVLRTASAQPPRRRPVVELLEARLAEAMERTGVPRRLHGLIRRAAMEAVRRGSMAVLNHALAQARVPPEAQEAITNGVRAALETPALRGL